jgi:PDZ domain-containing protein
MVGLPTGYFLEGPGPSFDLQRDLEVEGAEMNRPGGELMLTSVSLEEALLINQARALFDDDLEAIKKRDYLGDQLDQSRREVVDLADTLLSQYTANVLGLREAGKEVEVKGLGALIVSTFEGYPAYDALNPGEVIVSAGGGPVEGAEQLREAIRSTQPGENLLLEVKKLDREALRDALGEDSQKQRPTTSQILSGEAREVELQVVWDPEYEKPAIGVALEDYFDYASPVEVEWDLENVQGPSAGLMMTLALINVLTQEDLTAGRKVAGTGEVSLSGEVGPIGGLPMKIKAAEKEGAEIFLYPRDNQEDLEKVSTSLELHAVGDVGEALQVLRDMR